MANEVKIVVTGKNQSRAALQQPLSDLQKIRVAADKIPEKKEIKVTVKDDASKTVDQIDKKKVDDKETKVTAKDEASATVDKVSKQKPAPIVVPIKADDSGFGDVRGKLKEAGSQGAASFAGGFAGALAGGDLLGAATGFIENAMKQASATKKLNVDLQNQMGITEAGARQYGQRIAAAYGTGLGESKEQIASVYSTLSSDVQGWATMTMKAQDQIAQRQTKVAQGFGVEVTESIQAASSAVTNKLVPTWQDAQDLLVTGYQTLGSRGDDWAETLTEYSGYFKQLGIDGPQALGLIQQGLQAGARDTDYVADVWKEAGIRLIDTAKSTADAYKLLGYSAKETAKIQQDIAGGGPPAEAALSKVITKLQGIKDPVKQNEIGVGLFGTQYEDTFRRVIQSTDLAKAKATEYKGAVDEMATATMTNTERLSRWWDEASGNVAESASSMIFSAFDTGNALAALDGDTFKLGVSLDGTNRGFQALADTVGGYASPRFVDMTNKMTDSQLAAYGVDRSLDELGNTVLTLPNGKQIVIDTNSGRVISDLAGVRQSVNSLPTQKFFTYYIDTVTRGGPDPSLNSLTGALRGRNAAGGAVVGHAAEGGARGGPTLVNEHGTELGRTQRGDLVNLQSGMTVETAGRTAALQAAAGGGQTAGGGGPIIVQVMLDKRQIGRAVVDDIRRQVGGKAGGSVSKFFGGNP